MGVQIEWEKIQPKLKWTILSQQKGFAAWAIFTSIGSMMLGKKRKSFFLLHHVVLTIRRI
jgi:hypothetical protein